MVASRDANKENVDVTHNVPHVKKREHVSKNALEVPLKTRGNDADVVVVLEWKKQKAETDDDDEADFVRASLTPYTLNKTIHKYSYMYFRYLKCFCTRY